VLAVVAFVHHVTARFYEVDRAGILFFGRVFEMCHAAYEELLLSIGLGIEQLFEVERTGMPLVHVEADFGRPIRMHDRLDVSLTVERLGDRSVSFAFRITGAGAPGDLRATARLVHAFVTHGDLGPASPPPRLLAGLRQLGLIE
jgi:acyl-CoA thioesterase FadM